MSKKELSIVGMLIRDHSEFLKLIEEIVKLSGTLQNKLNKAKTSNELFSVLKDAVYLSFKVSSLLTKLDDHIKLEEEFIKSSIHGQELKKEVNMLIEGIRRFSEIEEEIRNILEKYHRGNIALKDVVERFTILINELQKIVYQHVNISDRILHIIRQSILT